MWGLSKVKRFFKERREKYLEEAFIETNFSVALDTNDLSNNLNLLKGSNHIFSERDSEYIYKRLREKAKLIRESYDDGIFNYMAGAFEETAFRFFNHQRDLRSQQKLNLPYILVPAWR